MKNRWHELRFLRGTLLVVTPLGMVLGLHEAWRLTGGMLVLLMTIPFLALGLAVWGLVRITRRENEALRARQAAAATDGDAR